MADYHKCFIENLKYYRKIKGITQAQLAEKCDVSNGTIGNIESGITKPSFDLILQLSVALDITPEILFHTAESSNIDKRETDKFSKEQLKKIRTILNTSVTNVIKSLGSV